MEVAQQRAAAARLRELANLMATQDLDERRSADLLKSLDHATAAFATPTASRTRFARGSDTAPEHPLAAGTSGVYPPLLMEVTGRHLVGTTRFDAAWEGPPDVVHGGFLAAGFDMVLSSLAGHLLGHALTRHLHLRYLRPTYLGTLLRYEVHAAEPVGRLVDLQGRLYADDQLTMRASAQFASIGAARFADRRAAEPAG